MRMQDKWQQVVCRGGRLVHGTARIARVTLNAGVWRGVFNGVAVVRLCGDVWQIVEDGNETSGCQSVRLP